MDCSTCDSSFTVSQGLLKLMSIEFVMFSNHLILLPPSPFAFNLSSIRVFPNELLFALGGQSIGAFSFSLSPSNEYSGLTSFRIDWFDLLAVQGTMKSFLQHQSSKAPILRELNLLYGPILTSIHDYWKNHSFD